MSDEAERRSTVLPMSASWFVGLGLLQVVGRGCTVGTQSQIQEPFVGHRLESSRLLKSACLKSSSRDRHVGFERLAQSLMTGAGHCEVASRRSRQGWAQGSSKPA